MCVSMLPLCMSMHHAWVWCQGVMSDALELQLQMAISSPVSLPAQPVVAEPPPALSIQVWFWYFFQVLLSESLQQSFCLRVDRVLIFIYLCVCVLK